MALPLIGYGKVIYKGKIYESKKLFNELKIKFVDFKSKDALSIINGTHFMTALGALLVYDSYKLIKIADCSAALTTEALNGRIDDFNPKEAVILGGEPTIYPRLIDLIKFLKKECRLRRVGFTTNGIKLTNDEFLISLIKSGVDFINISYHKDGEFITYEQLKEIRNVFKEYARYYQKLRINTNVWKGNHDEFNNLLSWLDHISLCCDEIRLSNIIHKDEFSVNPDAVSEAENMYMTDSEYEQLFGAIIEHYNKNYTIIYNPEALGFVNYYLIPKSVPIIVNWNIDSKVSEQVCENDINNKKIHTVKCLVSGDISLSWNMGNKVDL